MKFYINYDSSGYPLPVKGKALHLIEGDGAFPVSDDFPFENIPEGKAMVIVIDHGPYDSAILATESSYRECVTYAKDPFKLLLWDQQEALYRSGMAEYLNLYC